MRFGCEPVALSRSLSQSFNSGRCHNRPKSGAVLLVPQQKKLPDGATSGNCLPRALGPCVS
jgi:hypothetical protein